MKSNYLGIIPARGGSQSIPRKNLVKIAGKPLIAYTFEAALASKALNRTILTTDDAEIAALGGEYNIEVPFMRPAELSHGSAVLEDVIKHALDWLKGNESYTPDAVVLLQPTSPLRRAERIDEAIGIFEEKDVQSLVSVSPPVEHPCDMVSFKDDKMTFLFEREGFLVGKQRGEYPDYYFLNGAIYIFKTEALFKYGSRFGKTVFPYLMPQIESIDIDSLDDLKIAELIIKDRNSSQHIY